MNVEEKLADLEQRFNALFPGYRLVSDDPWHDTGGMTGTGWGKTAGGYFKYRKITPGVVFITARGLSIGGSAAVADTTVILSAANGLPGGYQPVATRTLPAYCDGIKASGSSFEMAALKFMTDGSVQCFGISTAATVLDCSGIFDINI